MIDWSKPIAAADPAFPHYTLTQNDLLGYEGIRRVKEKRLREKRKK